MSEPETLIERLREAADEIELLRAELDRVRQAHRSILDEVLYGGTDLCDEPDIDRIHDFAKIGLKDMIRPTKKTA